MLGRRAEPKKHHDAEKPVLSLAKGNIQSCLLMAKSRQMMTASLGTDHDGVYLLIAAMRFCTFPRDKSCFSHLGDQIGFRTKAGLPMSLLSANNCLAAEVAGLLGPR